MTGQSKTSPARKRDFAVEEVRGPKGRRFHANDGGIFHLLKTKWVFFIDCKFSAYYI